MWRQGDLTTAFSALKDFDEGGVRHSAIHGLTKAESQHERERLFGVLRSMETSDLQAAAWKEAVRNWADVAPFQEIVDWIGLQEFEHPLAYRLEREAAVKHASHDPRGMAEWLVTRSDESSLPGHLNAAVEFWAASEPNACGEWLREVGLGPHTDRAVDTYARRIIEHDPESAFAWAQAIHDETTRDQTLSEVSRRYYRFDPQGFVKTVQASELSTQEQEQLLATTRQL